MCNIPIFVNSNEISKSVSELNKGTFIKVYASNRKIRGV